ncbi:MAG: helix-turn-helix domain-containing protein, partial [Desulfosarcinaceae bacterium]
PGNVRELENTVERAVLISSGPQINEHCLLLEEDPAEVNLSRAADLVGLTVKELEKKLIEQTLSHVNQNRTSAARMLGISIRTLRNKLHEYGQDNGLVSGA